MYKRQYNNRFSSDFSFDFIKMSVSDFQNETGRAAKERTGRGKTTKVKLDFDGTWD